MPAPSLNKTVGAGDDSFGPQLRGQFDFTLLFEQTIFTILPSCLFLVVSSVYVYQLSQKPVRVRSGLLLWLKLAISCLLLGAEFASAILWSVFHTFDSGTSLAAAALSCITAAAITVMLYTEHRRSLRSSAILSVYFSITMLLDTAKARTYLGRSGLSSLGAMASVAAVLKLGLLLLEEVSKKSLIKSKKLQPELGPESTSGFWNRSLFLWLNTTLLIGFKNIISVDDLTDMGPEFRSETLLDKFQAKWTKANKKSKHCLAITCAKALIRPSLGVIVPRLCFTAFTFSQPLLLQSIVKAVGQEALSRDVIGGLVGATVLVYFGLSVTKAYYQHLIYRSITMARGQIVSSILQKTLLLSLPEAKKSAAITLMSTDMNSIQSGINLFHEIWASIIELGIGVYLLATLVGGASFLVAVPAAIITLVSFRLAKQMGPARLLWVQSIQERVAATSAVLGQLKGIKMTGLAPTISSNLQGLRVTEVQNSKKSRVYQITLFGLAAFSNNITPVIVMAGGLFWTSASGKLSAAEAFSALSIISLVSSPLDTLLVAFPQFLSIMTSFGRIQSFLLLDEEEDWRSVHDFPTSSEQGIELQDISKISADNRPMSAVPAIKVVNASIAVGDKTEPLLSGVDLSLHSSSLTMIIGPVGSGKTTLLKTLLGETKILQGTVTVTHGNTAYCDQTPWLRNVTIRDNIVAQNGFEKAWYETVIHCCLLDEDFEHMPDGDQALAGSGGINLSGGQRQRIALARAVYSRKPVLILDDVFSALDETTSAAVFNRLFNVDGIVRESQATVVIATNTLDYLAAVDNIVALDSNGIVSITSQTPPKRSTAKRGNPSLDRKTADITESQQKSLDRQTKPACKVFKADSSLDRQRGDTSLYYFYLKSNGVGLFSVWLAVVALSAIWQKMPAIYISIWLKKDPENNTYFAGFAVLGATSFLCSMAMLSLYMMKLVPRSAESLHLMLVNTVMQVTIGFISLTDTGTILNRFSQDMTFVNQLLPRAVSLTIIQFFAVLVDIGVIVSGAKYAAAILPVFVGVLYVLQKYYLRTSRQMRHLDLEAKSPLYTQLTETASGVQHIRAFGWQEGYQRQSLKLLDYSQKPYYNMFCIQRWLTLVLDFCVLSVAVILVTFALNFTGTTSESAIGLSLLNVVNFSGSLSQCISNWIELETSLGAIARLKTFMAETPVEPGPQEPQLELPANWPQHGRIELNNVTAAYNADGENSHPVLNGVSVNIAPGQKIGIIGRTGSGKSSLILTLLHLLEYSGSIVIDGIDIAHISRQQLRSRITTLPQDPIELDGSVRDNLAPFLSSNPSHDARQNPINDDEMEEALSKVGIWKHISSQGGLDASLSTVGLSQGQKQLLCLARAILHNASMGSKILLVDEATSNVDPETDSRMQAVMADAFTGCTVLTIAHRLKTLEDIDVVLEMDAGSVVVKRSDQM